MPWLIPMTGAGIVSASARSTGEATTRSAPRTAEENPRDMAGRSIVSASGSPITSKPSNSRVNAMRAFCRMRGVIPSDARSRASSAT